jgi:hypothetical protein
LIPPKQRRRGRYARRWNIETTFEEARSYLGMEKTRGWKETTVLRVTPCLFGLYGGLPWYAALLGRWRKQRVTRERVGKGGMTFGDALKAVRRWLWSEWVLARPGHRDAFAKIPGPLRDMLLQDFAPAA